MLVHSEDAEKREDSDRQVGGTQGLIGSAWGWRWVSI